MGQKKPCRYALPTSVCGEAWWPHSPVYVPEEQARLLRGDAPEGDPVGAPSVQLVVVEDVGLSLPCHPLGVGVIGGQNAPMEVVLELGDPADYKSIVFFPINLQRIPLFMSQGH